MSNTFLQWIVCRTIVDRIHAIICCRLDKYKPIQKVAVPSNAVSHVHFCGNNFHLCYASIISHLCMLKLYRFCFNIYTCVDKDVSFRNIYGLHVVWQQWNYKGCQNIVLYFALNMRYSLTCLYWIHSCVTYRWSGR